MPDTMEELKRLKREIEEAKRDAAQGEGRLQGLLEKLEDRGIKEDKLSATLKTLEKELSELDKELANEYAKLKEEYSW